MKRSLVITAILGLAGCIFSPEKACNEDTYIWRPYGITWSADDYNDLTICYYEDSDSVAVTTHDLEVLQCYVDECQLAVRKK